MGQSLADKTHREHLYLIGVHGTNIIKIGVALNPHDRLRTLQGANHCPLYLFGVVPFGGYPLEKDLHRRFSPHQVRGEWFHLTVAQVQGIPGLDMDTTKTDWGTEGEHPNYREVLRSKTPYEMNPPPNVVPPNTRVIRWPYDIVDAKPD